MGPPPETPTFQKKFNLYIKNGWTWIFIVASSISIILGISTIWNRNWWLLSLGCGIFLVFSMFFIIGTTHIREKYMKPKVYRSGRVPSWKQIYRPDGALPRYINED